MKKFYDKNGVEIKIGDKVIPDEGQILLIVSQFYVEDVEEECLFGQQIENPLSFSYLTQDNLSSQWTIYKEV